MVSNLLLLVLYRLFCQNLTFLIVIVELFVFIIISVGFYAQHNLLFADIAQ